VVGWGRSRAFICTMLYSGSHVKVNTTFHLSSTLICTIPDQVGLVRRLYSPNPHEGRSFVPEGGHLSYQP